MEKELSKYVKTLSIRFLSLSFFLTLCCNFSNNSNAQLTWYPLVTGTTDPILDLYFINDQVGWAVGGNGVLLHTVNSGITWTSQNSGFSDDFKEVFFINSNQGVILGDAGTAYVTLNGGTTWTSAGSTGIPILESVYFVDQLVGWACGSDGTYGKLYKTTNGGANWVEVTAIGTPGPLLKIDFASAVEGWVVGESGIYHTADGTNWAFQSTSTLETINSISMVDINKGWAVADNGIILHTTDGGDTWFFQSSPTSENLMDIEFIDFTHGMAVGLNGTVLHTIDGTNWTNDGSFSNTLSFYTVDIATTNIAFVGGSQGKIYKSPSAENDLEILAYLGFDTLCANISTPVNVTIINNGPGNITSANIAILQGSNLLLFYSWTGNLAAGEFEDVYLGNVSINNSGVYTGAISGDSVAFNNLSPHTIFIIQEPATVSGPHTICPGDSADIAAYGGTSYTWHNLGLADSMNALQSVSPSISRNYEVQIVTEYCTITKNVSVVVDPCTEPISAFSPNGDGVNDILFIDGIADAENTVKIYNRWGDLVNSFTNYNNVTTFWEGQNSNGEHLGAGTYFYSYEAPSLGISGSSWVQIVVTY